MSLVAPSRRWIMAAVAVTSTLGALVARRWPADAWWILPLAWPLLIAALASIWLMQRRAGVRLRRAEQRFLGVAEASSSGLLIFDAEGRLTFANRSWAELTGSALSPGTGYDWLESFGTADRRRLLDAWRRTVASGEGVEGQLPYRRADGSVGAGAFRVHAERGPDGQVTHLMVGLSDETARARTEVALAEREESYRLLARHSSELVLRLSDGGLIQFASDAAEQLLDTDPAALLGQPLANMIHPDDWHTAFGRLDNLSNAAAPIAFRIRAGRHGYRWVEAGVASAGAAGGRVVALRDISARRAAEQSWADAERKLRETNRLLTLAEGLANVGHWHAVAATGEVLFSSEAQALLGIPSARCSFTAALALVHDADRRRFLRLLARSERLPGPCECQLRLAGDDGVPRTMLVRLQAERGVGRAPVASFGVVTDITDKLAAEARLTTALDQARAAVEAKATFLATMSHEIRTPMTGVLGMIELLRGDSPPAERAEFLDTLEQSADLLMTVLNDILEFSRLDGGHLDLAAEPFDLREAVGTAVRLFERTAAAKGLQLAFDWRAVGPARAVGDRVRLQQVLSNLISNAIKFTEDGRVTVSVTSRCGGQGRQRWRIAVQDHGIGISAEDQARLFQPFVQADRGSDRRFGGTGLGLAISRRLVDGMGGKLKLRSKPGKGSTFWIGLMLPVASSTEHAAKRSTNEHSRTVAVSSSLDVLVAEDNQVNRLLIEALLRRMGHRPTCVVDGEAVVAEAGRRRFDLILMDVQMPRLDGLGAARAIRGSQGPSAGAPIVALTADALPHRRFVYAVDEIDAFLPKPIDSSALAALIADLTGGRNARTAAEPCASDELDCRVLREIREALGPGRTAQLLTLFAQELAARPAAIRHAIGRSDLAAAAAQAHSLRGASLSVGGRTVGQAAAALERVLATPAPAQAERLHAALGELDLAVASTIAALPQELVAEPCAA